MAYPVPDELWAVIEPLLPAARPKPEGGRPRVPDREALAGILFVLRTGVQWCQVSRELGCSGKTCWRACATGTRPASGRRCTALCWSSCTGRVLWTGAVLRSTVPAYRPKRGRGHRAEPRRSWQAGTKRHLVVDARGTPLGVVLGVVLSGASRHDGMRLAATLDAIPPVRTGKRGRPRHRPDKLHADKAYDHRRCRAECRRRGITPRIARRGIEDGERLGRHRWVVERTLAWLGRFRRLTIRYERRADIHLALTTPACAIICLRQRARFCP